MPCICKISLFQSSITTFGGQVLSGCTFSFDSILTDVATMATTAHVVENVGISAVHTSPNSILTFTSLQYLGATHLVSDPHVLEATGSILTVKAYHQTVLNILSSTSSAIPQAFDIAMLPSKVLAIAGAWPYSTIYVSFSSGFVGHT